MTDGARDRMIASASRMLALQGFHGASFSAILDDADAPRGSIYHHFPGGKDALILEAIDRTGQQAMTIVDSFRGLPTDEIVGRFTDMWRRILTSSGFHSGCSVLGATVSAPDARIIERAAAIFRAWQSQLADVLENAGLPRLRAEDLASTLVSACEGAVVLCRAERSFTPLDRVGRMLRELANAPASTPSGATPSGA